MFVALIASAAIAWALLGICYGHFSHEIRARLGRSLAVTVNALMLATAVAVSLALPEEPDGPPKDVTLLALVYGTSAVYFGAGIFLTIRTPQPSTVTEESNDAHPDA